MDAQLAIFAKPPIPGRVKTRLAADIGAEAALAVYHELLAITARAAAAWPGPITVHVAGEPLAARWPLADFPCVPQCEGGLGRRLRHGLAPLLKHGPVLAIGTDCPAVHSDHLATMARLLEDQPVALGPAGDGGYWCLGIADAQALPVVCADDLPWSEPDLLAATEADCAITGFGVAHGPALDDCDTLADLERARAAGLLA